MLKKIFLAFIFIEATVISYAQTTDAEADAITNLLGVQKKEAMSKMVSLSAKDSGAFWQIYDDYTQKSMMTAKERIRLYENTAMAYRNLTPAIADSLAIKYFKNRSDQEKTLEEYYAKIKK